MQKVLIPYDGSDSSNRAVQFVLDQPAAARPAEIHLLNVQEWPVSYGEYLTSSVIDALQEAQIQQGRKVIDGAVARITACRIPVQTHVLLGDVAHAVVEQATILGCDQIVMGTRGLGAVKGLFVGSITTKVLHLAKTPVTLIK